MTRQIKMANQQENKKNSNKGKTIMDNAKRKELFRYGLMALVASAVSVVLLGCSTNAPVAPALNEPDGLKAIAFVEDQLGQDPFAAVEGEHGGLAKPVWWITSDASYADVGVDGATIYLNLGNGVSSFDIPNGAVCNNYDGDGQCVVRITAKAAWFQTPYGNLALYDFGPDGLQFAKDCKLRVPTGFGFGKLISLYWFNPSTGQWEVQQSNKTDKQGFVQFNISHFSKYAIT